MQLIFILDRSDKTFQILSRNYIPRMADLFPPLSGLPGPPGEHRPPAPVHASYSDKIKVNLKISERLKRNVLEISVESQGYFKLEEDDVAKLMTRLGIDLKFHAEG